MAIELVGLKRLQIKLSGDQRKGYVMLDITDERGGLVGSATIPEQAVRATREALDRLIAKNPARFPSHIHSSPN